MGYLYPPEFPQPSRARIEAVKIQAGWELEESKEQPGGEVDVEAEVRKYILSVFAGFAQEALALGRLGVWTVERVDYEAREFLSCLTLEAELRKGRDAQGRRISPLCDHVFGHILPKVQQEFEKSTEWRRYQQGLLEVAQLVGSDAGIDSAKQNQTVDQRAALKTGGDKTASVGRASSPRRNAGNEAIDKALCEIAKSRPRNHEEVFRALDGRVNPPPAKPFSIGSGWMGGFRRDKTAARAWLSKAWSRLQLPPFRRGPK